MPSCGAPLPGAHLFPSPSSPVRERVLPPWSLLKFSKAKISVKASLHLHTSNVTRQCHALYTLVCMSVNVFFLPGVSLKLSQAKFSMKASLHLQHRQECKFLPATKAPLALPRQLAKLAMLDCSPARRLLTCSPAPPARLLPWLRSPLVASSPVPALPVPDLPGTQRLMEERRRCSFLM